MKILILQPFESESSIPKVVSDIKCFSDVLAFYLPPHLAKVASVDIELIPSLDHTELAKIFSELDVSKYDAIITLGLRFYSKIPVEITNILRNKFTGLFCQTHDGTRLDNDPVDVTFTFKDDAIWIEDTNNRLARHTAFNECMGWAADSVINAPNQSKTELRILVDHTNYGPGDLQDMTKEILYQIKEFIDSKIWDNKYKSVLVRRFDSGTIVDVDFDEIENIVPYIKSPELLLPITELANEHSKSHVFCVTHPESVGLVVLETALAGALIVTPPEFIPSDRLSTVRAVKWEDKINWKAVLKNINPKRSRKVAIKNNWNTVAQSVINTIERRAGQKND